MNFKYRFLHFYNGNVYFFLNWNNYAIMKNPTKVSNSAHVDQLCFSLCINWMILRSVAAAALASRLCPLAVLLISCQVLCNSACAKRKRRKPSFSTNG